MAGAIGVEGRRRRGGIETNGGDVALGVRIDRAGIRGAADAASQDQSERKRYQRTATHDGLGKAGEVSR